VAGVVVGEAEEEAAAEEDGDRRGDQEQIYRCSTHRLADLHKEDA